ncbi:MAG: type II secretion system major pseudopilin GspG [Hyphomicrobiaceae bacterium]|nr:type II secretion system major pseudopilin GspG [Hyphomicrobiaceae bacterium]
MTRPGPVSALAGRKPGHTGEGGFTLLELLVVLGIIVMLATVAGPQVLRYLGKARTDTAKAQLGALSTALELYALDNGGYPAQQVGLGALMQQPSGTRHWRGPYLKRAEGLMDPWGRPYQYRHPGQRTQVEIFTLGRDNAPGGTDEDQDVTSW